MSKRFQPSNGTHGMWFIETYCMNCFHCDPDPEGEKQCEILCRSMVYDIKDPEYPDEWTYDAEGNPMCTEHKKWDWDTDGNPDDNIPPDDPNQLMLFSLADEALKEQPFTLLNS